MITWLHGGVKWKIKIKTEKFTHILSVWPCQGVVRIGHVPVSAWTQLPVALWVSFPHAGAAGDDSSSPLCWDVPPGTVYGPLCISAAEEPDQPPQSSAQNPVYHVHQIQTYLYEQPIVIRDLCEYRLSVRTLPQFYIGCLTYLI